MALPPSEVGLPTLAVAGRRGAGAAAGWVVGLVAAPAPDSPPSGDPLATVEGWVSDRSGVPPGLSATLRPGRALSAEAVAAKTLPSSSMAIELISASLASYRTYALPSAGLKR